MIRSGSRNLTGLSGSSLSSLRHRLPNPVSQRTFATEQLSPNFINSPAFEQVTRLPNKIRVATEAVPGHFSGIGIFIDAGSRYEDASLRGVSHIIDRLAFKSTKKRTSDSMFEAIETLGGNIQCGSSRESVMYQSAVFNKDVPETLALLAETIRDPLITDEEVEMQLETAEYEIGEIWAKPALILPEILHAIAYKDNTLGNPLLCPRERLSEINRDTIMKYRNVFYQPEKIVVAFAGVQHEDALELVEQYLGDMKSTGLELLFSAAASTSQSYSSAPRGTTSPATTGSPAKSMLSKMPFFKNLSTTASSSASHASGGILDPSNPHAYINRPAHYTGGARIIHQDMDKSKPETHDDNLTHIYIAFESPGVLDNDIYASATLQTLLGGGGSFSAGGPGKGMYSRLYTNVLNQHGWIENCMAFNHAYTDSGLFGISAACHGRSVASLAHEMVKQLQNTCAPSGFNSLQKSEVERAKNQLRSSLLMNLESRMVELEDLGRQVQIHGKKVSPAEMCEHIQKLSVNDLKRVAKRIMRGNMNNLGGGTGKPTIVIQGPDIDVKGVKAVMEQFDIKEWTETSVRDS